MNAGPIAHRYAKALLRYTQETGRGQKVCSQARTLVRQSVLVPGFADAVQRNPDLPLEQKLELIAAALGEEPAQDLGRFFQLVSRQGRLDFFFRMLTAFIGQYNASMNIKVGTLTTASLQEGLRQRLEKDLSRKTGSEVILHETTDESLIGGFVLELDGMRADGSVADQFRRIRNELVENNNRII